MHAAALIVGKDDGADLVEGGHVLPSSKLAGGLIHLHLAILKLHKMPAHGLLMKSNMVIITIIFEGIG